MSEVENWLDSRFCSADWTSGLDASAGSRRTPIRFFFSCLSKARTAQHWPVDHAHETVSIEIIDPDRPMDYDFEFLDTGNMVPGDYYYDRTTQLNGAQACSSPVWVAGEAPR